MEIKKLMVIGAGQMGSGIAQVAAEAGMDVVLNDFAVFCSNYVTVHIYIIRLLLCIPFSYINKHSASRNVHLYP